MRATLLRYRWQLQTVAYFGVMVSLGLAGAALGPTLPSLAAQTGVTIGAVSVLFSARSLGYLCGSLLSGRLYDRLPGHPVMAAAALLLCAMLLLVPQVPLFWMLVGIAGGRGPANTRHQGDCHRRAGRSTARKPPIHARHRSMRIYELRRDESKFALTLACSMDLRT